jgi:hypothetical protein
VRRAALGGRYAADDFCAVSNHLLRVKCSFFARDALNDKARIVIN